MELYSVEQLEMVEDCLDQVKKIASELLPAHAFELTVSIHHKENRSLYSVRVWIAQGKEEETREFLDEDLAKGFLQVKAWLEGVAALYHPFYHRVDH